MTAPTGPQYPSTTQQPTTSVWNIDSTLKNQTIWWSTGHIVHTQTEFQRGATAADSGKVVVPLHESAPGAASVNAITPTQIMNLFAALQFEPGGLRFRALQNKLAEAGFITSGATPGVFDAATQAAVKDAMTQYLQVSSAAGAGVPMDFTTFLNTRAKAVAANGTGSNANVSLMDPDYLAAQAQNAAQSALGHSLTQAQLNAFVNEFHSQQVSSAGLKNAAGNPYYDTNRAPASAQDFIAQNFQGEAEQHQAQGYMDAVLADLLPGGMAPPSPDVNPIIAASG